MSDGVERFEQGTQYVAYHIGFMTENLIGDDPDACPWCGAEPEKKQGV